jgi:predicted NAD/FAD-binding protein
VLNPTQIVFNPSTYPNFLRFLQLYPAIPILKTEMTFSVSRDGGLFEWAGNNLKTIFCQPSRLLDPNMWRLIYDVLRFNACARRLAIASNRSNSLEDLSIKRYLDNEGYSDSFRDNYLIVSALVLSSRCRLYNVFGHSQ